MEDPNITMEKYIMLEEGKARRSVETEFPAIVFNDALTCEVTLPCEPTVSPLNDNKIDFRISFDKSDDEDYTIIYNENSFSYRIISVNNLKTDSENDNKVNMPSFPSPEPSVSCFDDLDFFKDIKNDFPAIVYNDALTSKSDFSTELTLCPQHIDEFDLKHETSLSECDEELRDRNWKLRFEHSAMPSYFHKKFRWGTVFATGRRSFIKPGTGLRMKRTNHKTRVPIGLYPCHIEEKMNIKEVKGESWKTKVTTKEGVVIQFPRKFRRYKLTTEEEVEENKGLKEVWEKMEYVISDIDSNLKSTASS
ncbi:hypothetical protein Tco_1015400 [Tanacetum coccineum]|uniref:Uncharacterized protein n=1 Tax=Tanacetum coccineum TaxID=301880 RepID=A0ABQ5FKP0_9ASTR